MKKKICSQKLFNLLTIISCSIAITACGSGASTVENVQNEPTTVVENNTNENSDAAQSEVVAEDEVVSMENDVEMTEAQVYFNWCSGFYAEDIELTMNCPVEGAKIYYTTDGSVPSEESLAYEGAIKLTNRSNEPNVLSMRTDYCVDSTYVPTEKINKANVIRAIAVFEDGSSSVITNGTFFVGLDRKELYGDVPVISLITDQDNLFNYETGIFVLGKTYDEWLAADPKNAEEPSYRVVGNYANKGKEWERPVHFEYIPANGKAAVSADMGLRMKGASTRTYLQKSMKLIAREEYGTKSIKYDIIPGNQKSDGSGDLSKYKSFVLRNGGNDTDFGKLRDPFWQTLVSGRQVETQQYCPCVVYLDGEYWGLYTIVEDYSDSYFENNYGIDKKEVVVVKCGKVEEGEDEDIHLYNELFDFITENDMADEDNYNQAKEMLDMQGFIEYCAFNFYIYNHDSIIDNNNWSMWRTREASNSTELSDGKWRMMVYDTEFSSGVYTGGMEFDQNNIKDALQRLENDQKDNYDERKPAEMIRCLLENESFKGDLINTILDMRNYDFEKQYAWKVLGTISPDYELLVSESIRRYGPEWVVAYQDPNEYYKGRIKELQSFVGGRYGAIPQLVKEAFGLTKQATVQVTITDKSEGCVKLNNTLLDSDKMASDKFSGIYFTDYSITVTAIPAEGKKFVRWELENCEVNGDLTSDTIEVFFTKDCKITPIYN